jgi:hypothetical protein
MAPGAGQGSGRAGTKPLLLKIPGLRPQRPVLGGQRGLFLLSLGIVGKLLSRLGKRSSGAREL